MIVYWVGAKMHAEYMKILIEYWAKEGKKNDRG